MNIKLNFAAMVTSLACISVLSGGCSNSQDSVQKKEFSPARVKSIIVDYDGESVAVYKSDTEKIVIVEYMDKNRKTYFAHMDLSGDVLSISEGARPIGNGVHSYVVMYKSKGGDLAVTRGACYRRFQATGDGGLEMSFAKITGDIYENTKNGDIALTLPGFLNFSFSAESRNGSVQTSFSELSTGLQPPAIQSGW